MLKNLKTVESKKVAEKSENGWKQKVAEKSENQQLKAKMFFKKNYIWFVENVNEKVRFSGWTNFKFEKKRGIS